MSIAVVVPTCRKEQYLKWIQAWTDQFGNRDVVVYVIEDFDERTVNPTHESEYVKYYSHKEILEDLGYTQRVIPFKTGAIRSYGFYRAYKDGHDIIITLDDDCFPVEGVDLIGEYLRGFDTDCPVGNYFDVGHTFDLGNHMRGYPFRFREKAKPLVQYGGWDNVPDLDAITQAKGVNTSNMKFARKFMAIPEGLGFTGCIMNVAFKREATPMMYQLVMGVSRVGYDRWDDIWSGLFIKKICDHLHIPVCINGKAVIEHTRASDIKTNLAKENGGYELNETMWEQLSTIALCTTTIFSAYWELYCSLEPGWFGHNGLVIDTGVANWITLIK